MDALIEAFVSEIERIFSKWEAVASSYIVERALILMRTSRELYLLVECEPETGDGLARIRAIRHLIVPRKRAALAMHWL